MVIGRVRSVIRTRAACTTRHPQQFLDQAGTAERHRRRLAMPAATTTSGRSLTVGLLIAGCLLAGCGQGNPYSLPEYDAKATSTGSPAESGPTRHANDILRVATPSPEVRYRPADALGQGAWVKRGRVVAKTSTQRAVARAVMRYLSVRLQ